MSDIIKVTRIFRHNGMNMPDPAPGLKPDEVRNLYAASGYPQLLNAKIVGPTYEGENEVYTFEAHVGHKG